MVEGCGGGGLRVEKDQILVNIVRSFSHRQLELNTLIRTVGSEEEGGRYREGCNR